MTVTFHGFAVTGGEIRQCTLRKESPRSTGVERANTRATARRRGDLFIGFGSENRTSGSEAALAADTYAVGGR
jgi:hypothetical protein